MLRYPLLLLLGLVDLLLLLSTSTLIAVQAQHVFSPSPHLDCQLDDLNVVHCQFSLPQHTLMDPLHLTHCSGTFCVEASVQAHEKQTSETGSSVGLAAESLNDVPSAPLNAKASEGDTIVVGKERYVKPFKGLPREIAHVLKKWPTTWSSKLEQAQAFMDLGLTHQRLLELEPDLPFEMATKQVTQSVNALQQAIQVYQNLQHTTSNNNNNNDNKNDSMKITHQLARCNLEMGKAFSLSPDDADYGQALDHYGQAEKFYRKLLSEDNNTEYFATIKRYQAEAEWAQCCMRIGVKLLTVDEADIDSLDVLDFAQHSVELHSPNNNNTASIVAGRAEELFMKAETLLRNAIEQEEKPMEKVKLQRHLATTLQNLGTAEYMKSDLNRGAKYCEEALALHEETLDKQPQGPMDHDNAVIGIAEVLYNLADTYLQLGQYDDAKTHYRRAMEWYESHSMVDPPQPMQETAGDHEAMLEYEQALDEYYEKLAQGSYGGWGQSNNADEQRDDAYEADLHASLGSLYMAKGDTFMASSHLRSAIDLYDISGYDEDINVADAKYNLAVMYFHQGDFASSADYNDQALNVYRIAVGEGNNPMEVDRTGMPEKDLTYIKKKKEACKDDQEAADEAPKGDKKNLRRSSG